MRSWGESGSIDPFSHVPAVRSFSGSHAPLRWFFKVVNLRVVRRLSLVQVLFQTTVRCLACHDIADDPLVVARLRNLYDKLDKSTTPASVLLPWLPSPSMLTKLYASKKVYDIVNGAIKARMSSGVSRDDTLQMLLDHGDDKLVIVGVIQFY